MFQKHKNAHHHAVSTYIEYMFNFSLARLVNKLFSENMDVVRVFQLQHSLEV